MADEIAIESGQIWQRLPGVRGRIIDADAANEDAPKDPSALIEWKNGVRTIWRHTAVRGQLTLIRGARVPLDFVYGREWKDKDDGSVWTVFDNDWVDDHWMIALAHGAARLRLTEADLRAKGEVVPPLAHDFSDRFCADSSSVLCLACGGSQRIVELRMATVPEVLFCRPKPGWRFQREVELTADQEFFAEDVAPEEKPARPFRQSVSKPWGGVFSLRDES